MSLTLKYSDPQGIEEPAVLVSLGSNVRFGDLGLGLSAELGEPAVSTLDLDDPGGIYTFVGLRAFDVRETSAASNNQMIGRFVIQNRTVKRDPERGLVTLGDRLWTMDLTDYNWHLGKRILVDADSKRPAETSGDRIRWLLNNAAHISLNDYGHVTYPSDQLDAHDYRGEQAGTVLSDCCVEGGYLFWCDFNEAHGKPELFFLDPNNAADTYRASIGISNALGDVNGSLVFEPYEDATLERSTERLAYGVYLPYTNGFVYVNNPTTGDQFAQVDRAAPMSTVHTAAKARRVATKFLNDNGSESDRIKCSIKVPVAQVNDVRHGQLMAVKFSHLPGYEDIQLVRVLQKTVQQEEEGGQDYYRIGLEMVPLDPPVFTSLPSAPVAESASSGGILYEPESLGATGTSFQIYWDSSGDAPGLGYASRPRDAAHFDYIGTRPHTEGWQVLATHATLDLHIKITMTDVASTRSYIFQLRLNGTPIATDSYSKTGGLSSVVHAFVIDVADLTVVAGDRLTTWILFSEMSGASIPAGTGGEGNSFEILNTSTAA